MSFSALARFQHSQEVFRQLETLEGGRRRASNCALMCVSGGDKMQGVEVQIKEESSAG